jgi:CheY-like chemotaxis protein
MKKHILIIDDDEDDVKFFHAAVIEAQLQCKCTWAKNGTQALEQLQYITPDLILLDYNMPGLNGLQCLVYIKKLPLCTHVPVILQSPQMTKQLRKQGMLAGAAACIAKPASLSELRNMVTDVITAKLGARIF